MDWFLALLFSSWDRTRRERRLRARIAVLEAKLGALPEPVPPSRVERGTVWVLRKIFRRRLPPPQTP